MKIFSHSLAIYAVDLHQRCLGYSFEDMPGVVVKREMITASSVANAEAAFRKLYKCADTDRINVEKLGPA